eukprot:COSAG06_NODE_43852_length_368_cov_0.955390_1_plen_43_part_10
MGRLSELQIPPHGAAEYVDRHCVGCCCGALRLPDLYIVGTAFR